MFVKPRIIIVLLFSITISYSQDYRNVDEIKEKIKNSSSKFYWVCPLIEESEELDLKAAEQRYKILKKHFKKKILLMHGRLSEIEKEEILNISVKKDVFFKSTQRFSESFITQIFRRINLALLSRNSKNESRKYVY